MNTHTTEEKEYFNYIYDEMYRSLYLYAASMCQSSCDIEDVLQETFKETYVLIRKVRNSDNPEGFVMNILKNKLMKWQDRQKKDRKVLDAVCNEGFRKIDENYKEIWDFCKNNLKKKDYLIIRCRYCKGFSIAEIAGMFGISEAACKMRIKRSLNKLKKLLT